MAARTGPLVAILCGVVALFLIPITTAPANEAGTCGRIFAAEAYKDPIDRNAATIVFQEQRQESTCEDARNARWLYVALALAAALVVANAGRWTTAAAALLAVLLAIAAVLDGPLAPLGVAALGAGWSAVSGRHRLSPRVGD